MSVIIGIDLGTTNSLAAHLADEGPRLIPNALGDRLTPSVVGIDPEGKLLVGSAAKELDKLPPVHSITSSARASSAGATAPT